MRRADHIGKSHHAKCQRGIALALCYWTKQRCKYREFYDVADTCELVVECVFCTISIVKTSINANSFAKCTCSKCELLKLVISIPMLIGSVAKLPSFSSLFFSKDAVKMSVPASLYFVQNLLGIVGFSRVPVPIVAVLGQTKVATSAIFTVFMLDRKFSAGQVRALIQVVLGASLVVLHTSEAMEQAKGGDQPVHQVNFWMHWVPLELIKRNNAISNKRR